MPPQIATSYTPAFERADIGVGGVAALGMMAARVMILQKWQNHSNPDLRKQQFQNSLLLLFCL